MFKIKFYLHIYVCIKALACFNFIGGILTFYIPIYAFMFFLGTYDQATWTVAVWKGEMENAHMYVSSQYVFSVCSADFFAVPQDLHLSPCLSHTYPALAASF